MRCITQDEPTTVEHHSYVIAGPTDGEHDYDEPYFEPASEVDGLLKQLRGLDVTSIEEKSLKLVKQDCDQLFITFMGKC
jgi:hypothetical protein